jgi:adenylate kinase family enzyme
MRRILIFGNSGSGKTWLASKLSNNGKKHIALDDIFWLPGGYNKRHSEIEIFKKIEEIKNSSDWIVEGVFGKLLVELINFADVVIFLDLCWDDCKESLLKRGSESSIQLDIELAEKNFQELIIWASNYYSRNSQSSYRFHKSLYEQFNKEKFKLSCRNEVDLFLRR